VVDYVQITPQYYELKLKELVLHYSYLQQLENEKEQKRVAREKLIEEEKVRREIEQKKVKIKKEMLISFFSSYNYKSSIICMITTGRKS